MSRHLVWFVCTVFCLSQVAAAQTAFAETHRIWEFSVFGGSSYLGDKESVTPVAGSTQESSRTVTMHYGTGYQLGARVAENRWDHWGASLEYGYSNQPLSFRNLSPAVPSLGLGHAIHRMIYDVAYYPLPRTKRLRPYGFVGGGVTFFDVDASAENEAQLSGINLVDQWKFTGSWGGGVKFLVQDRFAVDFQFSDRITGVPGYGLPRSARVAGGQLVPGFVPHGSMHNWLIGVALAYQWGER